MAYHKTSALPSVTAVLQPWTDFSMVDPEVLALASERGSAVHEICAGLLLGMWVPPYPDEYEGYVLSFRSWMHTVEEVAVVEAEMEHQAFGYCGHPDFLGRLKGDRGLTLIDWKTPQAAHKTWRLQLAAYKGLCEANGYTVDRVLSLRLRKDGRPPLVNEYTGTAAQDLAVFIHALTAFKFFNGGK